MPYQFKRLVRHRLFFPIVIAVVYFVVNLILVLHHEQWRGEVNPWQIAKSLNLENVVEVARAEPQSFLWYLVLLPFAKLGLPLITANIISLVIMSLSVFLLARYAPFSKVSVVVLVLSAVFFYFNPVIADGRCLVVLGMVVAICIYKTRPVAALLVVGVSALLVLPAMIGAWQTWSVSTQTDWLVALNKSLFGVTLPVFELTVVFALIYLFFNYLRRPVKLYKWAQKLEVAKLLKRVPVAALIVIPAAATIPMALISALDDLSADYSYSHRIARYINEQTPPDAVILTASVDTASAAAGLIPLLKDGRRIYDVGTGSYIDFYVRTTYPDIGQDEVGVVAEGLVGTALYYLATGSTCAARSDPTWVLMETFYSPDALRESPLSLYEAS